MELKPKRINMGQTGVVPCFSEFGIKCSNLDGYFDGVRIRLKRGGRHGSESVSDRGVHHGHIRILQEFKRF
jgi:hypothetical protein